MINSTGSDVVDLSAETYSEYILDNIAEGCQLITSDFKYLYVNHSFTHQIRRRKEDLIGKKLTEVYPGIENTSLFSAIKDCQEKKISLRVENLFEYPSGSKSWFEFTIKPVPSGIFIMSIETSDRKRVLWENEVMFKVLELINNSDVQSWGFLLRALLVRLKQWSNCEAVGIRIREGNDFPYFVVSGFSDEFVKSENHLCSYTEDGTLAVDANGNPLMDCLCGKLLSGKIDSSKNFFTPDGNFWSNAISELLVSHSDIEPINAPRYRCIHSGYESLAIIPLRSGKETFGLFQFNDRKKGRFTLELIALLRRIADNVAAFLEKKHLEMRLDSLNSLLFALRSVSKLTNCERDRDTLIKKICQILVDARGFHSVFLCLTDRTGKKVLSHSGAGTGGCEEHSALLEMFKREELPECFIQALTNQDVILRKSRKHSCKDCPVLSKTVCDKDVLVIPLMHSERMFGYMKTCLQSDVVDDLEERVLLKEVADDIAFALYNIETECERDKSSAELIQTENQLRQSQKLEIMGHLATGIAHDFNNILAIQSGHCDMMLKDLRQDDPCVDSLNKIKACADRAAEVARQLLAFSRKQTINLEIVDLNTVVTNLEKILRRLIAEDIDIQISLQENPGKIKADPGHIEQIIFNLSVNSRDSMPNGGKLIIKTFNVMIDEEYIKNHPDALPGSHVMLQISDTGSGMDEQTKNRIFEPFFTTKNPETAAGLGLPTVYGIVKQAGGRIWVESEPGKGTTFKIYFPCVENHIEEKRQKNTSPSDKVEFILLVEDDTGLREIFGKMVKGLGYKTQIAANGEEAYLAVNEGRFIPDLVITDMIMPGMNGVTLVKKLREIIPKLKVLYTSGYSDKAALDNYDIGVRAPFIQKPFSLNNFAAAIRNALV
ncbi:MAG: response regulator [Candidatus Riflebacteria bacterium]|nr:response regulator [Candidatus Riflebacteria bacterium]